MPSEFESPIESPAADWPYQRYGASCGGAIHVEVNVILALLMALQIQSRATYDSIPALTLVKEIELRGPEVQRPWSAAIWGTRLAVTPDDGPDADLVLLFDLKTGSYLGQLGRRGSGPGEFRMVRVVRALPSGELLTVDVGNARVAWWKPGQHKPRKEETIVGGEWFDAVPWLGDTVLFAARSLPQEAAGYPLHLSANRHIVASFGTTQPHLEVGNWTEFIRRLSSPSQGCWWAIPYDRQYLIQCFDSHRQLVRQFARQPSWFVSWPLHQPQNHQERVGSCRAKVYTNAWALEADGAGRVWVAFLSPSKNYANRAPCVQRPIGRLGDYMDMPIEVLNGRTGRLLASSTLNAVVITISTEGRIATYDEDANGEPVITVWRARVANDRAKGDPR